MVAIKKTSTKIPEANYAANKAYILIARKNDATVPGYDWKAYDHTKWQKYQIKETDFRTKTASFTTPQYIDLTTGMYCVLITSPMHEDFSGVILSVEYDRQTGLYTYQCQDWSRLYQSKFLLMSDIKTVYRMLQYLISRGEVYFQGAVSKAQLKKFKRRLSGLRPAYQYAQKAYGSTFEFNPMTEKKKVIIRNKSFIEAIRDLVYGSGAYIDVYFNKYGIIQIEPYHKDDFFNTGLLLTSAETSKVTQKFDTTNVISGVIVDSTDKTKGGNYYSSTSLINLDLRAFFGDLVAQVSNPTKAKTTTTKSSTKTNTKKNNTKTKTDNPYKTKKKVVWINSDNILGRSADVKFINDVAAILRKNGWTTKNCGVSSHAHEEGYANVKNGVWFCIYGGADAAVFKEAGGNTSYHNKLKRMNSRTVIGMHGGGDIRKGGKYYKWLGRAHDDNYSPASFRGLSYPLNYLTKHKIPIMYASTAKQMAAKFLAGGDNPEAC